MCAVSWGLWLWDAGGQDGRRQCIMRSIMTIRVQVFSGGGQTFVVLAQAPIPVQPGAGALQHPGPGQHLNACQLGVAADNGQRPVGQLLQPELQLGPPIALVGPESGAAAETAPPSVPAPGEPRPGPGAVRCASPRPGAGPWCRLRFGTCGP